MQIPSSKGWSVVFWASAAASAAPILATRYVPFTDAPEHTAAMATIARLMPGGGGAPYELALRESQYLLFHLAGALVTRVVGDAMAANVILLVATAMMWPVAMRSLLRAFGRDERLAIFAGMPFWNRATVVGLEPYVASVPLLLFCIAQLVRQLRTPTRRRAAFIAVLSLALFYAHASSFVLFAIVAFALAASSLRRSPRHSDGRGPSFRAALGAIAPLAPSVAVASVWARVGGLKTGGPGAIERMPIVDALVAAPVWTFDIWHSHLDEVCAGVWWIAYGGILIASFRNEAREDERKAREAWLPFACALAIYVMIPARIGPASMLNVRLAPVLALFALLGLRLGVDRIGRVALAVAAFATASNAGVAVYELRRAEREIAGDFGEVLRAMKPGTRLALLNFEKESPHCFQWPYPFAGAYHVARGGAVASFSFAELPHWSVHYASDAAPPSHAPFWAFDPCAYRFREDGRYYDYVLVQGDVGRFEAHVDAGPRFEPIVKSARFTLYEKVESDRDDDATADIGPCAR